ncbi:unnamed protein product [Arctia plantaginis]|uniref:Uncharacterized protein n=1 Tax=Arctia plantaginis TaxID=874455 RepID=A0A8S1AZK1_ARCPL|nr:unnamed protein product [Arctia plantaginis]
MQAISSVIFISVIVTSVTSYPGYWSSTNLNPVHSLYVKPSSDGSKGDLFVAASEDSGVKSQWMVDQPINFLPIAAATQPQATTLPVTCPFTTHNDETSTHKRAVMPNPVSSPQIQYAYALPVSSTENNPLSSYPYVYPVPFNPENPASKCEPSSTAPHYPFPSPFQFFYPQMMSAYSNAMTILKDAGLSDDAANSVMAHHASPMWGSSPYAYPMYLMVNPGSWYQNQDSNATTSPPTSSPSTKEEEVSES